MHRKRSPLVVVLVLALVWSFPAAANAGTYQYANQVPKNAHSAIYPGATGTLTGGKVQIPSSVWMYQKAVASLEYGYEYWRAWGNGSYWVDGTHLAHANSRSMCWWWIPGANVSYTVELSCWRYTP